MEDKSSPSDEGRVPLHHAARDEGAATGLPLLHTWRAVYLFVLGGLVVWVGLLYLLSTLYR